MNMGIELKTQQTDLRNVSVNEVKLSLDRRGVFSQYFLFHAIDLKGKGKVNNMKPQSEQRTIRVDASTPNVSFSCLWMAGALASSGVADFSIVCRSHSLETVFALEVLAMQVCSLIRM